MHLRYAWVRRLSRRRPRRSGKRKGLLWSAILGIGLALLFIWAVDLQLRPILEAAARAKVSNVVTRTLDGAISDYVAEQGLGYRDLIRMETDENGRITALVSDMAALNALRTRILGIAVEAVDSLDRAELAIPAGNLTGINLLSGKGMELPVEVVAVGTAHAEFESSLSDAGINQTRHQILLDVTVAVEILLPGSTLNTEIGAQIPVAETVIVGTVPDTVLQWGGA